MNGEPTANLVWRDGEVKKLDFDELILRAIDGVRAHQDDKEGGYLRSVNYLEILLTPDLDEKYHETLKREWEALPIDEKDKFASIKLRELILVVRAKAVKNVKGRT